MMHLRLATETDKPAPLDTRESWLLAAAERLRGDLFQRNGATVPLVRVSVGFPGGGSARKRIGEYWSERAVADGVPQVFISPVIDDPVQALDVLVHELIHAVYPASGHKGPFKKLAIKLGLTGKMTATVAGPALKAELQTLSEALGPFPNSRINLSSRKKQTTRLIKAECQECGYTVRVAQKWIDEEGPPLCPCNSYPMEVS